MRSAKLSKIYPNELGSINKSIRGIAGRNSEDFLNGETEFKKLKTWDSLGVLMVIDGVEMEFGVLLRKQDFDTITTLAELYEQIKQRRSA